MTVAQKEIRSARLAVRRRHPSRAGLTIAMEKDHGRPVLLGALPKDIGVVHMGRGPFPRRIVVTDVKGSRRMDHGPAGRKDALFLDLKDSAASPKETVPKVITAALKRAAARNCLFFIPTLLIHLPAHSGSTAHFCKDFHTLFKIKAGFFQKGAPHPWLQKRLPPFPFPRRER